MRRNFRLRKTSDFKRVRRFGKSYAHPLVVLVALPNETEQVTFAITASRALGNAVLRNRAKRLLREALRPHLPNIQTGWDVVLVSRPPLAEAAFPEAEQAVLALLKRARLLRNINGT